CGRRCRRPDCEKRGFRELAFAPGTRTALLPARPRAAMFVRMGSLRSTRRAMRTRLPLLPVLAEWAPGLLLRALRVSGPCLLGRHRAFSFDRDRTILFRRFQAWTTRVGRKSTE